MSSRAAIFSIKGVQRDQSGEESCVEMMTDGVVQVEDGCTVLSYEESALSGLEGHRTHLRLSEGAVDMERVGEFGVHMHFEKGRQHLTQYETPYGPLAVTVFGNQVYHALDETGGKVLLEYVLNLDGAQSFENTLRVDIKFV